MLKPDSIVHQIYHDEQLSFTEDEVDFIEKSYQKGTFQKGETILRAGEKVDYQYFVADGCLRTYLISKSGKEHTIQFAIKGWWISDYIGFFSDTNATLYIECIEDATLYKVSREAVEEIFNEVPKTERFIRKKLERAFVHFQKRILSNLSQTAKERYLNFTHEYPNIEQHVKNYHIASYLGITTESLSRIRKEIT
ncbi:transcriptional activator protein Anr [Kordia sp. SMS9]|uniref:Crp/Fnr family transcriptional regulator n=1 Tax=Kordia sp. SMS9 TaxID=2282170 RepID=UPI000E0CCCBE|nr:Crp/Fnr family transcriptional regulator [Kordia sp. SMS9]AXG70564.1 transcriptional activator protein Anr [Kordia sp. SMS9]